MKTAIKLPRHDSDQAAGGLVLGLLAQAHGAVLFPFTTKRETAMATKRTDKLKPNTLIFTRGDIDIELDGDPEFVPTKLGYARVSTDEQSLDVQITALRAAGVEEDDMYIEKVSAVDARRPQFHAMMKQLQPGDVVHVHSLSRLGRDAGQIRDILTKIKDAGATWKSWTEPHLDSTTAAGRLMINITSSMAQFERDQVIERTKRGMAEAKRKGMSLGRKRRLMPKDIKEMKRLRKAGMKAADVAAKFNCSVGAVYNLTKEL